MKLTEILTESSNSDRLAELIEDSISSIDETMGYKDFATAVAKVLRDSYGKHLYKLFTQELLNDLSDEQDY